MSQEDDRVHKLLQEYARENDQLRHDNTSLVAEVNMLRDELERSDRDRMRLQGFSATLVSRLSVIRETIENAAREAVNQQIPQEQRNHSDRQHQTQIDNLSQGPMDDDEALRNLIHRLPSNSFN